MQDLIGRTLGHYRIVDKIGEGGMGEVYRARDERLDRDVAIKVLPEAVAQDEERLARFEREAKLLASLNNPNIATLHGLEEDDGRRFLVMELVEGESLATVLAKGAVPLDETLPIALQITEALEAAHENAIIHRDLKPANVMVSPEGKVKVLDFGLAKACHEEVSDADLTHSPTLTAQMTSAGVLLGTAAYMSPEQARGKPLDKRSDIWAFGVVLYEMLTGTRAFSGDSATDILATIIKDDPDWDALSIETPAVIRRLLRRCLTKDPRDRLHDIADARIELHELFTSEHHPDEAAVAAPSRADWRTWLPWGLAAAVTVLAVSVLVSNLRTPPIHAVTKVLVGVEPAGSLGSDGRGIPRGESYRLSRTAMDISPDGRHLVFGAGDSNGSKLYLRSMDAIQATPIDGTEGGVAPFFSPDGEWIGFWADRFLKKVRIDGSQPVPVCGARRPPFGANWGPFGTIAFGQYEGGILRVSADGGTPEEITSLAEGEFRHSHPRLLADGETLLFTVRMKETGDWDETTIVAQSLKTGERKILVENGADPRYAPTGHLVFVRLGTLMAAPFDQTRLEVTGGAGVVLKSVRQGVNANSTGHDTFSGQFAFSSSGVLVHVPGGVWSDAAGSLVWVDREGRSEPLSVPPGPYWAPRLSPNAERAAVSVWGFEKADIWLHEIVRGTFTRLTFEDTVESYPIWTPDGARITFSSDRSGREGIYWIPADGSGTAERLSTLDDSTPASWSPDGQVLAFLKWDSSGNSDIWMLPLGDEPHPFVESPFNEIFSTFSPDGRWLAYGSNQSGRMEIYVTPYPGPGPKIQISTDGGWSPAWAPSGRELFYIDRSETQGMLSMWAVEIATEAGFSAGRPTELFSRKFMFSYPVTNYDVKPDGQAFLIIESNPRTDEPVTHMHVTLNWFEELKRLVPTN